MISRYFFSFNIAVLITFSLFYAMQMLIANDGIVLAESYNRRVVIMPDARKPEPPEIDRKKPEKQEIELPPEISAMKPTDDTRNVITSPLITGPDVISITKVTKNSSFFKGEGEYIPIVRVAPQYPSSLAEKGIEGYVILSFTVTATGAVANVTVIETSHRGFERSAIRAVQKFKYKPRIIDGEAVPALGVTTKIVFQLENS